MEDLFIKAISLGTLFLALIILSFVFSILFKSAEFYKNIFKKHGLKLIFVISLVSAVMSLILSDVLDLPPCDLCWYQRIFMYPIAIISGWALLKKDYISGVAYSRLMAIIGLILAIYHVVLERSSALQENNFVCGPGGGSDEYVDCAVPYFVEFGFVSIPFMSLIAFLLILLISIYANKN